MKVIFEGDVSYVRKEMLEYLGLNEPKATARTATQTKTMQDLPANDPSHTIVTELPKVAEVVRQPKVEPMEVPQQPSVSNSVVSEADSTVDSDGLPWDGRIHSSNQERVKDGTWRKRRGMNDKAFIAQVEAELRAKTPNNAASSVVSQPENKTVPPFGSMSPEQYQQTVQQPVAPMPTTATRVEMPAMPVAPVEQAPVQQAPVTPQFPPNTYNFEMFSKDLVHIMSRLISEGRLPGSWVNENKHVFSNAEVYDWNRNEPATRQLFDMFAQWGFINKAG